MAHAQFATPIAYRCNLAEEFVLLVCCAPNELGIIKTFGPGNGKEQLMTFRRGSLFLCACLLAVGVPVPSAAFTTQLFDETQTLRITDPGALDDLGYSLGVGAGSLIAGAINVKDAFGNDVGAAYVY